MSDRVADIVLIFLGIYNNYMVKIIKLNNEYKNRYVLYFELINSTNLRTLKVRPNSQNSCTLRCIVTSLM